MAFANPNISDILATTIEHRSKKLADNVTNNNAVLKRLSQKGRIRTFSGGYKILQEMSFAENPNASYYSGYDLLPVGVADVISAAEFNIKQAACPVVISGLEQLMNSGKEQMIDLMEARLQVAESTLTNLLVGGIYSDGTGFGGKEIDGLGAMLPLDPSAAPYAGIDGGTFAFWRNKVSDLAAADVTPTTIQSHMNDLWARLVRGADRVDLIMADHVFWTTYLDSLQTQQRFTNTNTADAGFMTVKYMDADVVLDGGMYNEVTGSGAPPGTAFFLNTNYIHWRPHAQRNMVPLSPNKRYAVNQDAECQIIAFAGNLTCSGRQFQGRLDMNS